MLDTIKKAYRYYFYRMYLFYLKRWNNSRGMGIWMSQAAMMGTFMANFATLFIIWVNIFKINRTNLLPDYKTHKPQIIVAIIIINTIFLIFNRFILIDKFDEIVHEFKNEDKKTHITRGWIVTIYEIGSYVALFGLMLATI
ncbi:hypothetical protein AY601_0461 [Pedobacter cryoconitis]|uniref:Uncharacterized protein n=1 Tax=Pedobacter cryoconitis TaxID=188932 RepID=A0A127V842_9SPHI|nr:hypothetical protein [Pedobacter cryoconitis]AMP97417.1 hypothetical protein AY601_0461 [Pedobacter cryoconitis]